MTEQVHFVLVDHTKPDEAVMHLKRIGMGHLHGGERPDPRQREGMGYVPPQNLTPKTDWGKSVMHAVTKDQGFSFHNTIGDGPTSGYMVSTQKSSEHAIPIRDLTPEVLGDYRDVHQQELADPDNYLGGWVHKGKVYLDISRHVTDQGQAAALAKEHNQIGIYDLGAGQTMLTSDLIPTAEPRAAHYVSASRADDVDFINALRAQSGLDPLPGTRIGEVTPLFAREARRLLRDQQ